MDGALSRKITITEDGANKQFVLTNSTDVNLVVKWNIIIQLAAQLNKKSDLLFLL
ncbi:TPA: hypothetical protein R0D49_004161 [Bacillus cereus]|nr:hypothetical protein [Bacillus cereus]